MTLISEQWHIYDYDAKALRLATQTEIDTHFAARKPEQSYWYNDHS